MPADTVIDAERLTRLGITGAIATLLAGKTVAQAAEILLDDLDILLATNGAKREGKVSYSIDGQSVTIDVHQAELLRSYLIRVKSTSGGGPVTLGVAL
jgi:hypothetical protein